MEKLRMKTAIKTVKDLKVYLAAYKSAMAIFRITENFPKKEIFSLIDQLRRSSRSVAVNIREGYAKRKYKQVFIRHLNDALGSSEVTRGWLDFAKDSKYINIQDYQDLDRSYDEINAMLYGLMKKWQDFSGT